MLVLLVARVCHSFCATCFISSRDRIGAERASIEPVCLCSIIWSWCLLFTVCALLGAILFMILNGAFQWRVYTHHLSRAVCGRRHLALMFRDRRFSGHLTLCLLCAFSIECFGSGLWSECGAMCVLSAMCATRLTVGTSAHSARTQIVARRERQVL